MCKLPLDADRVASSVAPPFPPKRVYLPDVLGPKNISPLPLNAVPVELGSM